MRILRKLDGNWHFFISFYLVHRLVPPLFVYRHSGTHKREEVRMFDKKRKISFPMRVLSLIIYPLDERGNEKKSPGRNNDQAEREIK